MLVGSNAHRGPHRIKAWIPSLVHYCFLDDARTQRVVAEPNALNEKMISVRSHSVLIRVGADEYFDTVFGIGWIRSTWRCHIPTQDCCAE